MLAVTGFHLLVGLVLAFGLRRDALDVGPFIRDFGIWATDLRADRVLLTAVGPRQDLGHPGTIGLSWEGGYARVGDVQRVEGLEIEREFQPVSGELPVCVDKPLLECQQLDLESYSFPGDPTDRGLEYEDVTFSSPLGEFGAWRIDSGDGSTWAIHVHGWRGERREALRMLPPHRENGITSLVIDYRNDPGAPMDPTGRYRFGLTEWEELEAAAQYAMEHGAKRLILAGYSTGCAVIMSFLEKSEHTANVVALAFDSPNIIWADVVRANTSDLRVGGLKPTTLMKETGMWLADILWKIDWETTNYVQRAETTITVPTLVFHGTSDQRVPIAVSRQFEAAVPEYVELVEAPAAGHVMSWNANPDGYEKRLGAFLSRF